MCIDYTSEFLIRFGEAHWSHRILIEVERLLDSNQGYVIFLGHWVIPFVLNNFVGSVDAFVT